MKQVNDLLQFFSPITLEEMGNVRLMNRVDTKYITTLPMLCRLLRMAQNEYRVQEIDGQRNMPYYTCYFDTPCCDMFLEHLRGKKTRQKIRLRVYEGSGTAFFEIKTKSNKGRTSKKRTPACLGSGLEQYAGFINANSVYHPECLVRQVENHFQRITLVNKRETERLTIDTDLRFHNVETGGVSRLDGLVIIELKRDGNVPSPVLDMLRELRIHQNGFSKYCVGMALTNDSIKKNRLKPKLRMTNRMCSEALNGLTM